LEVSNAAPVVGAKGVNGLGELAVKFVLVLGVLVGKGNGIALHIGLEGLGVLGDLSGNGAGLGLGVLGEGGAQTVRGHGEARNEGGLHMGIKAREQFFGHGEVEGSDAVFCLADEVLYRVGRRRF
jgi:hypothetical protein